jgi:cell shape-determining protein MreC
MSQHLITQFINRTYVFKPFAGGKLVNQKLKKYQASNRNNNSSPEDIAESTHNLQKIKVRKQQKDNTEPEIQPHIDIIV